MSTTTQLQKELSVVLDLIRQAGTMASEYANNAELNVVEKADDFGPVTVADKAVNEFLVTRLHKEFPKDLGDYPL